MPRSIFTLFQVLTRDSWSEGIARHVAHEQPVMTVFFLTFMVVAVYGLMNVCVAVIVENTLNVASGDMDRGKRAKERERQNVLQQLREIFEEADANDSGLLDLEEVQQALSDHEIYHKLCKIDFPVEDPENLFELLDYDGSGEISIIEFITGCKRMRGHASSKDLLVCQVAVDSMTRHFQSFAEELASCQERLTKLADTAKHLIGHGELVFLNPREYRIRHPEYTEATVPRADATFLSVECPWDDAEPPEPASPPRPEARHGCLKSGNQEAPSPPPAQGHPRHASPARVN